jgi:zinc transport system substrate-binding protein
MRLNRVSIQIILSFALAQLLCLPVYAEKLFTVYTVNYPLTYFAERIGGDRIAVVFPAPPGVDPAFWRPDTATVRKYQQADLIILNGAGYEKWVKKVSLPMLRSIDTSRAFKDNLLQVEATVTHSHGPGGDHSHGGTAFTTWLDFSQAARQAEAIYKALSRKIPSHETEFSRNFDSLQQDLLALDKQMSELSAKKPDLQLLGSHPIYKYMARRYHLNLRMVMWEPDADPGKKEWAHLEELVQASPAAGMIWEGEPLPESVKRLQAMNLTSQVFSPCFSKPEQDDFLLVMKQNVKNIERLFD